MSLLDPLKAFVDDRAAARGYGSPGDYIRELNRREQDRQSLRDMLLEGAGRKQARPGAST